MALRFSLRLTSFHGIWSGRPKIRSWPPGEGPVFPAQELSLNARNTLASPPCCSITPTLDGIRVIRSPQINDLGTGRALCVSLWTGCVTANGPGRRLSDKSPRSGGRYMLHMCMMAAADMCMQCMVRDRAQEIRIWIRVLTNASQKPS